MTLNEIVELLNAGAQGCESASSESCGHRANDLLIDARNLKYLASQLQSGVHLWIERPDALFTQITDER